MDGLSKDQFDKVRFLIDHAPDAALETLEQALTTDQTGSFAIGEIRRLAMVELADRGVRDRVLAPIAPLCGQAANGLCRLRFPPGTLRLLWRAMVEADPGLVRRAATDCSAANDDPRPASHDVLCAVAAEGLRRRDGRLFIAVADLADGATPGGAAELAACLDLAPVVRRACAQMHGWLGRLTEERIAAARLTMRDAVAVADDASPRLMEMLFARLREPSHVLRLVSAVMDRPSDAFVAVSELASFGERLMDEVDRRLAELNAFRPEEGRGAGTLAANSVEAAAAIVSDFEVALNLSPKGPWGARILQQKRMIGSVMESRLRATEDVLAAALPVRGGQLRKSVRGRPRLTQDPEPLMIARAEGLIALLHGARAGAAVFGFGALRAKVIDDLQGRIDQYVEDLLEKLHTEPQAEDAPRARTFLELAAELAGLLTDAKAAQTVRRRAAAA